MDATTPVTQPDGTLDMTRPTADTLCVRLTGTWTMQATLPSINEVQAQYEAMPEGQRLSFETSGLVDWDSTLLTFLLRLKEMCAQRQVAFDPTSLPQGVQRLLALATTVPERQDARREVVRTSLLVRLGQGGLTAIESMHALLTFLGQVGLAF